MPSNYEKISSQDLEEKLERAVSLLVGLYTERAHFILELLQNAEDARATHVRFDLQGDRLEVGTMAGCLTNAMCEAYAVLARAPRSTT